MNLRWAPALALLAAMSVVACSGHALRGVVTDAGADATGPDAPTSEPDADASFNPCPEAPEPAGGTTPAGQPCTTPQECHRAPGESAACIPSNEADVVNKVQTCHRFSRAASGAACAVSRTLKGGLEGLFPDDRHGANVLPQSGLCDARDGLTCDWIIHTCTPFAALGVDCKSRACGFGTHCGPSGICEAPLAAGESCSIDGDFSGTSWCVAGSSCDVVRSICVPKRAVGAPCMIEFDCQSGSCREGVCGPVGTACIP